MPRQPEDAFRGYRYPAVRLAQFNGTICYSTGIPFAHLPLVTATRQDIQRTLLPHKINKIVEYLCGDSGWFPAVTLATQLELQFEDLGNGLGMLVLPLGLKLQTVDGQHRITAGMRAMLLDEGRATLADKHLPCLVFDQVSVRDQSQMFADINGSMTVVSKALREDRDFRQPHILWSRDVLRALGWNNDVDRLRTNLPPDSEKWFCSTWFTGANALMIQQLKNTDEPNAIRILTEFWAQIGRAIGQWWGDQTYCCSTAVCLAIIARIGHHIINREPAERDGYIARLADLDWRRVDGMFEGVLFQQGVKLTKGYRMAWASPQSTNIVSTAIGLGEIATGKSGPASKVLV